MRLTNSLCHHIFKGWHRLHPGYYLFAALIISGLIAPDVTVALISSITRWSMTYLGDMVIVMSSLCVLLCVGLAISPYGRLRLGRDDERPAYGYVAWFAMLFAAGMGSGLVFYGAAEPYMHLHRPPAFLADDAGRLTHANAMAVTYFHWGFHAWAIYVMAGLCIAYFSFRHQRPLLPSASVTSTPIAATAIDALAIIAVTFGLVASLSQGVLQLSSGVERVSGAAISADSLTVHIAIILLLSAAFMLSASTGIGKGIRLLSIANVMVACILCIFVLVLASPASIAGLMMDGVASYVAQLPYLSFGLPSAQDNKWIRGWSVTYIVWWIAWAPFVGVFIARISRGRTIREFIGGVLLAPVAVSFIWFAVFSGAALDILPTDAAIADSLTKQPERIMFALLEQLPYATISMGLTLLLLFAFLVTSADSGTYVLGMFARGGSATPLVRERLLWGGVIACVCSGSVLLGGNTAFFKQMAVFGGVPYMLVIIAQITMLLKHLCTNAARPASR